MLQDKVIFTLFNKGVLVTYKYIGSRHELLLEVLQGPPLCAVALGHPDGYCKQQILPCVQGLSHESLSNNQAAPHTHEAAVK